MIGLDTSGLIDLFKDKKEIVNLLKGIEEEIVLNLMGYLEVMVGLDLKNPKYLKEEEYYDEVYNSYTTLKLDAKSIKKTSDIIWSLKKKGEMIELLDCVIAGIYLTNGVNKIITKNIKHFENIKGLKIISY